MKVVRSSYRSLQMCCATFVVLAACSSDPKASAGPSGSSGSSAAGTPGSGSGGRSSAAGAGGALTSAGGGSAGASAGPGGSSAGGALGASGAPATAGGGGAGGASPPGGGACSREFLKSTLTAYFTALAAHSASGLPLADTVKVTENGKTITVGQDGLWKTAGAVKYYKSALDTDGCNTASEAVVPEGSTDLPVALRLKFVAQKITEIETIAVRAGDYKVSGSNYPSKPDAIIMSDTTVMWETPVPEAMRNTTQEMNAWMSKYFKAFPAGVCNPDTTCKRLENGNSPGGCGLGASCQAGDPAGNVIKSHAIFSDAETGIGVGFDLFMGNTDMHLFKMYGGKVYAVHAVLGTATSTGWDDK
ncbi:MAG: hypothetical protein ABW061_06020 [Polyangiaceae bacterium]